APDVVDDAVARRVLAGEDRGAVRRAQRRGVERVGEHRALVRQAVDVRRLHVRMSRRAGFIEAQVVDQDHDQVGLHGVFSPETTGIFSCTMSFMTPRAITIRPAEPRDAQPIAAMSRDFIESGLGWKYDAARVLRAMRDKETMAVVACEGGKGQTKGAPGGAVAGSVATSVAGFAIMEFGDERAHLVLLAVRPSHRRLGIGQRML